MIHLLAINRIPGISAGTKRRIAALVDGVPELKALIADKQSLMSCLDSRRGLSVLQNFGKTDINNTVCSAEKDYEICQKKGIGFLYYDSTDYPRLLKEITDPPFLLYYAGEQSCLAKPAVGVVGTRKPSGQGRDAARETGKNLALNGCVVVSGLAMGVDCLAHQGAVSVKGASVGVLGSGIDAVYPVSSRKTAIRMLEAGGAIVSEYPPSTAPARYRFPERNRIICGLSRGVIVIEAPVKSGALITADFCIDYNRDLFFHADGIGSGIGKGAAAYLADGASVVSSACQVLEALGLDCRYISSRPLDLMDMLEQDLAGRFGGQQ